MRAACVCLTVVCVLTLPPPAYALGPQGRIAYFAYNLDVDPNVYVVDADGRSYGPLLEDQRCRWARWSPDGRPAVWLVDDGLHIMDADGANRRPVPADRVPADWSPDGEWFATVHSWEEGGRGDDVAKFRADGSDYQALTEERFSQINSIEWSPDGRKLTFSAYVRAGNVDVFAVGADGQGLANLTNDRISDFDEHWSADGRRIFFFSERPPVGVHVMDTDGRNVRPVELDRTPGHLLATSPDGKYLLVAPHSLDIFDTDGRHARQLTDGELWPRKADWYIPRSILAVSPFGKRIGYWGRLKALGPR